MSDSERSLYAARRARVLERLDDAVLVLPAAPSIHAGWDAHLRYRPDPDLYYLTGLTEPEAVAVLSRGSDAQFTLFVQPRDEAAERWTGPRGGVEAARRIFGADAAFDIAELPARLPGMLARCSSVLMRFDAARRDVVRALRDALAGARRERQRTGSGPFRWEDAGSLLDDMRLLKDEHEIELLRGAARITVDAFMDAAARVRPDAGEWEIEAAVEAGFRMRGADGAAFPTIAAGGVNATVLHYNANAGRLVEGELVLLDAGAQYRGYAADVSRVFPVSGRFTGPQRALYEAVLAARDAAIGAVLPGAPASAPHDAALRVLLEALVQLGALTGGTDDLMEQPDAYRPFFPHRTSHWLGLDVHDVGAYARDGAPRLLEAGMVLTVEPAVYVAADEQRLPMALRGVGVRIEDDVLVTPTGAEVLTAALPTAADDVEAMLAQR